MHEFLLFSLAAVGFTLIVVDGSIFAPIRDALVEKSFDPIKNKAIETFKNPIGFLKDLTDCYQCSGVWVGWFLGWTLNWSFVHVFAAGFASSFLALLGAALLNYIESKTV